MKSKQVCHVISHSHWDREWYMPYEKHHVRLIELMDTLLALLETDEEFRSFHLDGQTIVLEDYLQVRPERKEWIARFVREGRLHIGPWYVLQDEFLTSSESNVRNLLIGHRDARGYGPVSKLGYFPDSFGNMGQAPQLLKQAGIDTAVFGRGVKPTGFNNQVSSTQNYESPYSEMMWESPDGSSVLGVLFANWYHNGMEIPVSEQEAAAYWQGRIANAQRFASTRHLLFMNGCDHQPVQTDLSEALRTARKQFPEIEFIHSNFAEYVRAVQQELPDRLAIIRGELRSQRTDGWYTLVNTASARVYLKQLNQFGQALLHNVAEPLAAMAHVYGKPYPHHLFTYAWKTLMQNHPHDSICGCSVDEVHQEMVTRFAKSKRVAEEIVESSAKWIAEQVDTDRLASSFTSAVPFVVFNSTGWERTGVVTVELDVQRLPLGAKRPDQLAADLEALSLDEWIVVDDQGATIPFTVIDLGAQFGYDLPNDRFRQPYMARKIRVTFEADCVSALGYKSFGWVKAIGGQREGSSSLAIDDRSMENRFVHVRIADDGTLAVTDKQSGHTFQGLCAYEDAGDIGNEYIFKQPNGEIPITTMGLDAEITRVEDTPYRCAYEIVHEWDIPACADELLKVEIERMVPFTERNAQRMKDTVRLRIVTLVSLERNSRAVKITTSFDNKATDHRLRVLFPSDLVTSNHFADSIFEVVPRENTPSPEWVNPSNCQHQQAFASMHDGRVGFTVANLGLNEYEVLRDGRNTVAVTLCRSVAELGDWGVFPTPEAQCLGPQSVAFEFIPHTGDGIDSGAYAEAYQFQVPWSWQQTAVQSGMLPATGCLLEWSGGFFALSAVKVAEQTDDLIVRWFNMDRMQSSALSVKCRVPLQSWYRSNILEERTDNEALNPHKPISIDVQPAEIVTLGMAIIR